MPQFRQSTRQYKTRKRLMHAQAHKGCLPAQKWDLATNISALLVYTFSADHDGQLKFEYFQNHHKGLNTQEMALL
jgi:hypothetical protein